MIVQMTMSIKRDYRVVKKNDNLKNKIVQK